LVTHLILSFSSDPAGIVSLVQNSGTHAVRLEPRMCARRQQRETRRRARSDERSNS